MLADIASVGFKVENFHAAKYGYARGELAHNSERLSQDGRASRKLRPQWPDTAR